MSSSWSDNSSLIVYCRKNFLWTVTHDGAWDTILKKLNFILYQFWKHRQDWWQHQQYLLVEWGHRIHTSTMYSSHYKRCPETIQLLQGYPNVRRSDNTNSFNSPRLHLLLWSFYDFDTSNRNSSKEHPLLEYPSSKWSVRLSQQCFLDCEFSGLHLKFKLTE